MTAVGDHWEHFPHGADVGIRGFGETLAAAFEQTALALTAIVTEPSRILPRDVVEFECSAPDDDLLLVDWLNAIVYEMATRGMLFSRFRVTLDGRSLHARAWGEPIDQAKHRPIVEIKGATYTSLQVARQPVGNWVAECIVDV